MNCFHSLMGPDPECVWAESVKSFQYHPATLWGVPCTILLYNKSTLNWLCSLVCVCDCGSASDFQSWFCCLVPEFPSTCRHGDAQLCRVWIQSLLRGKTPLLHTNSSLWNPVSTLTHAFCSSPFSNRKLIFSTSGRIMFTVWSIQFNSTLFI